MSRVQPEVSVLIPCYNGERCIGKCLETLARTRGPAFEVIVVDNGSTDGSLELVRLNPNVRILTNKTNQGFPFAINQGAKAAQGRVLVVLNQDTEVEPNWLTELTSAFKKDAMIGICGPKILDAMDRIRVQQTGVMVDKFGFGIYLQGQGQSQDEVFMVSGAAMAIRRDVFDSIGRFDPEYFLFEDDLDLCWRVHLAGFKVVVNSRSIVYHHGGFSMEGGFPQKGRFVSSHARRYFSERNTLQTLLKNYQLSSIARIVPLYIGMNIAEIGLFAAAREMQGVMAYLKALYYNLTNFRRTWEKHLEIERLRRVSDSDLSKLQSKGNLRVEAFLRWGVPSFDVRLETSGETAYGE